MMQHVVHKRAVIGKKLVSGGVLAVLLTSLTLLAFLASCRGDVEMVLSEELQLLPDDRSAETHVGFYLLNEGNMGSNKATLDFLDFKKGFTEETSMPKSIQPYPRRWATWATI